MDKETINLVHELSEALSREYGEAPHWKKVILLTTAAHPIFLTIHLQRFAEKWMEVLSVATYSADRRYGSDLPIYFTEK